MGVIIHGAGDCRREASMLAIAIFLGAVSAPAFAQETSAEGDNGSASGIEDIVITARKTNERLQNVPVSVTAVDGQIFVNQAIKDPTELQARLPAVEFQSSHVPSVIIRGIGTYNNQFNVDSAVAYNYDGTFIAHLYGLPPVMVDIAQVEALRGPQGTLFGRNANGGVINFISNRPVHRLTAAAGVSVGNYDAIGTDAMINLPLAQGIAFRAAFASDSHDGYLKRGYNDANNYAGRARLLIEPSDSFQMLSTVDFSRTRGRGQQFSYCPPRSDNPACVGVEWRPFDGLSNAVQVDTPENHFLIKNVGLYHEMSLDAGWATLVSLTSYRRYRTDLTQDFGGLRNSPSHTDKFFTQELRLASDTASPVKWVIGAFYSREKLVGTDIFSFGATPFVTVNVPNSISKSASLFGQLSIPVTDNLRLTGGGRYTHEKKTSFGTATFPGAEGLPDTVIGTGDARKQKKFTWKVGIDYDIGPASLLYGSVSTGFKSGGVNQIPSGIGLPTTYDPETITAYQIGSKNRFLDNRLQVNLEAFYYDYYGFQSYVTLTHPTIPGPVFGTASSQGATYYGGEAEAIFKPTDADRLSLSLSLIHAKFDGFVIPGGADNSGNQVPGTPDYTVSASYERGFDLADGGRITAQVETKLVAGHFTDIANAAGSYQKRYTRSGASLSYRDPSERWRATLFVRNLENRAVIQAYQAPLGPPGDLAYVHPPRTYGLSINWRFD